MNTFVKEVSPWIMGVIAIIVFIYLLIQISNNCDFSSFESLKNCLLI
jgi:hypothetical protein